jgi:hypothetical protein
MSKRGAFGPGHITFLVAVAIVIGLMANGSNCGGKDKPVVCTTDAQGQTNCPLRSGRQR